MLKTNLQTLPRITVRINSDEYYDFLAECNMNNLTPEEKTGKSSLSFDWITDIPPCSRQYIEAGLPDSVVTFLVTGMNNMKTGHGNQNTRYNSNFKIFFQQFLLNCENI